MHLDPENISKEGKIHKQTLLSCNVKVNVLYVCMYVWKSHHNIYSTFVIKRFAGLFPRDTQSIRGSMLRIRSRTDGPEKKRKENETFCKFIFTKTTVLISFKKKTQYNSAWTYPSAK